jgi:hypothetical protein
MRRRPQRGSAPAIMNPAGLRTGRAAVGQRPLIQKPQVVDVVPQPTGTRW